jgi:hypothetical protein
MVAVAIATAYLPLLPFTASSVSAAAFSIAAGVFTLPPPALWITQYQYWSNNFA